MDKPADPLVWPYGLMVERWVEFNNFDLYRGSRNIGTEK